MHVFLTGNRYGNPVKDGVKEIKTVYFLDILFPSDFGSLAKQRLPPSTPALLPDIRDVCVPSVEPGSISAASAAGVNMSTIIIAVVVVTVLLALVVLAAICCCRRDKTRKKTAKTFNDDA